MHSQVEPKTPIHTRIFHPSPNPTPANVSLPANLSLPWRLNHLPTPTMPGALKFPNLTILEPHNILPNLPSSVTTIIQSTPILRRNYSAGWWRRAIPCPTAAQPKSNSQIFRRNKSDLFSSDCGKRGRDGQFDLNLRTNLGTQMRATVNGKVDSQYYESDVSPRQNHPEKPPPSKLLTLPTILTIGRVAAVPLLVGTFYAETWWGPTVTTGIFIVAAFTDWLDGYLARKMNLGTPFGAFLDPVADKLMVAATLILLCTKPFEAGIFGQAPWLLTVPAIAIIGREITMSAVREWAASQDRKLLEAVAVNNLGKWKTAAQMISLTILLASRDGSLIGGGPHVSCGVVLLYTSAWLALWSLVVYMKKIWKVLLR